MTRTLLASKVIYILADNRSGSTLLDQLLGAHDRVFSVGEIHHLQAYVSNDRRLYNPVTPLQCSCGQKVTACPFWLSVESKLGRSLDSLTMDLRFFSSQKDTDDKARSVSSLLKRLIASRPNAYRNSMVRSIFNSERVAADSFELFDAIFAATNAQYIVDSSKAAFRFRTLYEHSPDRMLAIMLARDYRATIYSKMKRQKSLKTSAKSWVLRMHQIETLTKDLPPAQCFRIRYEDLCNDPKTELGRLCEFLGLDFTDALLRRPEENVHHIGGSPSKLDPSRKIIKLDTSYRDAFSKKELAVMKGIVGPTATKWGYD